MFKLWAVGLGRPRSAAPRVFHAPCPAGQPHLPLSLALQGGTEGTDNRAVTFTPTSQAVSAAAGAPDTAVTSTVDPELD